MMVLMVPAKRTWRLRFVLLFLFLFQIEGKEDWTARKLTLGRAAAYGTALHNIVGPIYQTARPRPERKDTF